MKVKFKVWNKFDKFCVLIIRIGVYGKIWCMLVVDKCFCYCSLVNGVE